MLIDLSSTNGCFVNGRRVREHRLRDGDLIAVGHHQLRFSGPPAGRLARTGEYPQASDPTARRDETLADEGKSSAVGSG
jgi:pSer/pThr/pTyr-binding forkhead associated (FHA) protein